MDQRKEQILNIIVKEHIRSGAPVGSGFIAEKHQLEVSPATIRNDMTALEEEGYIIQPHISAGRVPTEKAYYRFLEQIKSKKPLDIKDKELTAIGGDQSEAGLKAVAKYLARKSNLAVFWAFHRHNVYYTGLSNLFSQPEFSQVNVIYDISAVIDRIDEIIGNIFDGFDFEPKALIGQDNPFGSLFGAIIAKYKSGGNIGLFGVIGPMRMDYEENLRLVETISKKLNNK